jgi:arylsulfatase A-like enzyme
MVTRPAVFFASLLVFAVSPARTADQRPNFIFIMVDDLGNGDLGYRGSNIQTPNIDQLATLGVRLESFYSMPVCTPARASLMTGRYAMRYGLQTLAILPSHTYGLPTDERTLPQALKEVGYQTYMVGKWHLGHANEKYWPQNRGFDHFYGNLTGEVDYFTKMRGDVVDWQRDGVFLQETGYYTTLIGDEAVKTIQRQDASKPFFLYFASQSVHAPYQAPPECTNRYPGIADANRKTYAAMVSCLDDQVGRIVAALQQKGMRDNTLILFASDNGGPISGIQQGATPVSNAPYRAGKGSLYEGGVRVPAFANWPGKLEPGEITGPLHMVDIMPTLLALVGAHGDSGHPFDGKDIWPVLSQGKPSPHEELLINVEAFRGAIRKGNLKLIQTAPQPGKAELYDLANDPEERTDLAGKQPDVVQDLEARLQVYAKQQKPSEWSKAEPSFVGAQGQLILDPDFDIDGGLPRQKTALPKK